MTLEIHSSVRGRIPTKTLRTLFGRIARGERRTASRGIINVVFVSSRRMQHLNFAWRRKNKPTDVLSFILSNGTGDSETFGEVYICATVAKRQAKEYGGTLEGEYLRLACHGFLHLFGYDHHVPAEARAMRRREIRYLQGLTKVQY